MLIPIVAVWLGIVFCLVALGFYVRTKDGPPWLSLGFWICALVTAVLLVCWLTGVWEPPMVPRYHPDRTLW